jgi:molybdopterin molybdotransferase
MIPIDEAIQQLIAQAHPVTEVENVHLHDALDRVLAKDILSNMHVPPADNSAMDGYACHISDLNTGSSSTTLNISQIITAGHPPHPLQKGTAARIFTGAEIPSGANAVVMQEQCTAHTNDDNTLKSVTLPSSVTANNNIRPQGQDIRQGDKVLLKHRCLQAQDLGLLASIGIQHIPVFRKLSVAILSTGDELVEPGQPLHAGKIYNSNRYLLHGFLSRMGIKVVDCGRVEDTHEATVQALRKAADCDCIISTGGVSVGDEDHIKHAVMALGELDFWRIAIKPGKPVAFGNIHHPTGATPFIGLPGNPSSVFITFLLFANPLLKTLQHQHYQAPKGMRVPANFDWKENPKRQEYLRARMNTEGQVDIYHNQSSGVLSSTSWAEGVAVIPIATPVKNGDTVQFIHFNEYI